VRKAMIRTRKCSYHNFRNTPRPIQPILPAQSSSILGPPCLKRRLASSKADLSGMPVTPFESDMFSGWLKGRVHVTYTTNISPRSWSRSFHPCNSKSLCFRWRCMSTSALRGRRTLCSHPRPPSRNRIWRPRMRELWDD
jgi:hypothetical protein